MRISDWSSDVCSSDLRGQCAASNRHRNPPEGYPSRAPWGLPGTARSGHLGAAGVGQPGHGLVQGLAEGGQVLVDLALADDHRRAPGEGVAQIAEDAAMGLRSRGAEGAAISKLIEEGL